MALIFSDPADTKRFLVSSIGTVQLKNRLVQVAYRLEKVGPGKWRTDRSTCMGWEAIDGGDPRPKAQAVALARLHLRACNGQQELMPKMKETA